MDLCTTNKLRISRSEVTEAFGVWKDPTTCVTLEFLWHLNKVKATNGGPQWYLNTIMQILIYFLTSWYFNTKSKKFLGKEIIKATTCRPRHNNLPPLVALKSNH